jgi:hypothetical protein
LDPGGIVPDHVRVTLAPIVVGTVAECDDGVDAGAGDTWVAIAAKTGSAAARAIVRRRMETSQQRNEQGKQ